MIEKFLLLQALYSWPSDTDHFTYFCWAIASPRNMTQVCNFVKTREVLNMICRLSSFFVVNLYFKDNRYLNMPHVLILEACIAFFKNIDITFECETKELRDNICKLNRKKKYAATLSIICFISSKRSTSKVVIERNTVPTHYHSGFFSVISEMSQLFSMSEVANLFHLC